jgi:hypothetical protein
MSSVEYKGLRECFLLSAYFTPLDGYPAPVKVIVKNNRVEQSKDNHIFFKLWSGITNLARTQS